MPRRSFPSSSANVALPWLPAMDPPTFEAALRDVASTKPRFRRDAAATLRHAPPDRREDARFALRRLLEDADAGVRIEAVGALAEIAAPEDIPTLAALADDPHPDVRTAAVDAVDDAAGTDPAPLLALARHADPIVRAAAADGLGERDEPDSRAGLRTLLDDDAAEVRTAAAEAAAAGSTDLLPDLRRRLEDEDHEVRAVAALSLAALGDSAGRDLLRRLVDGPSRGPHFRRAVTALAGIADTDDLDRFARLDRWFLPGVVRRMAVAARARLGHARSLARLRDALRARQPRRRAEAVLAAGAARVEAVAAEIAHVLRHPEDEVFSSAALVAPAFDDPDVRTALIDTARRTADRAVFETLAGAAAAFVTRLGPATPDELRRLARAEFHPDRDPLDPEPGEPRP